MITVGSLTQACPKFWLINYRFNKKKKKKMTDFIVISILTAGGLGQNLSLDSAAIGGGSQIACLVTT